MSDADSIGHSDPSERLIDQRCRNRIIDAIGLLADGADGARRAGDKEYFNLFDDWVDSEAIPTWRDNTALTAVEVDLVAKVEAMLDLALDEAGHLDTQGLIDSCWPARVQPVARTALYVMEARGWFSDDEEEDLPSGKVVDLHTPGMAPEPERVVERGDYLNATVVCRHPYGLGLWEPYSAQFGHVNVPEISDGPLHGVEDFPPIGSSVGAVALGYSGSNQLRLSLKQSKDPSLSPVGCERFRALVDAVGSDWIGVHGHHERWQVYHAATSRPDLHAHLKSLAAEDISLTHPVVVEVLKHVGSEEGRSWVDLEREPHDRAYAERRLREWGLIRELDVRPRLITEELPDLSPWCQRRLVERSTSDVVLRDLAEHGFARKVRNAARERLRTLRQP